MLLFHAGLLYHLTGDNRYVALAKPIFLKYAEMNPKLGKHPEATSSSPGHIFWQALNDANWLVYAGLGYDLFYNSFTAAERKKIEEGAFKPEVDFFTKDLTSWFNLIHNHGVWACAGVGIVGIATGNETYLNYALRGTEGKGEGGFLAQMDQLFSPDGYYTEGPYYVRYAILPYYLFANALNHAKPSLKIFEYRNRILKKALESGLQQTNIDGRFFPLNDALKEKDFTSNELVTAIGIATQAYGADAGLLTVAAKQNRVLLHKGGAELAAALASKQPAPFYPYKSVAYTDGAKGDEGGVALLRSGRDARLTTLVMKYASHGLSHGHFDRLGYFLYDNGNEVLQDYGSVRFIGVEQKFGGRYLPENKTYASQSIAHSTLVLDETSHFDGKEGEAEKYHSDPLFVSIDRTAVQAVGGREMNAYPGVQLYRNVYMINLPGAAKPLVLDIFRSLSQASHQYDLPFQYSGNLIQTNFKYSIPAGSTTVLGKKNGYQFLWKEAEAALKAGMAQFTYLNDHTYYTISSLVRDSAKAFFTRAGANDPNFNLRREPSYIIRKNGTNETFVSLVEIHGNFDPIAEFSTNSYSSVSDMKLMQDDASYTVAEVKIKGETLVLAQANKDFEKNSKHQINYNNNPVSWTGPFVVLWKGKPL